jgi:tellurite resistance protein TerC
MQIWLWSGFLLIVGFILAIDLGLINRKAHAISGKSAMRWVGVFITLGALFAGVVYYLYDANIDGMGDRLVELQPEGTITPGKEGLGAMLLYLQAWIIEYSLSVDNIFVMALVFGAFRVPAKFQHRVLFWGILGAVVLRGAMILLGTALVRHFEPVLILFGGFLIFTAIKMLLSHDKPPPEFERMWVVRGAQRIFRLSTNFDGQRFFTRLPSGVLAMTPLFLVLLVVEATDVVFAVDSIPACFGITQDPFLVFTSNIFAILGLRSLYFALAALLGKFEYLPYSLAVILAYVGVKMVLETLLPMVSDSHLHFPPLISLGVIVVSLVVGITVSILHKDEISPELAAAARTLADAEADATANDSPGAIDGSLAPATLPPPSTSEQDARA